jgi:hypothetical protein
LANLRKMQTNLHPDACAEIKALAAKNKLTESALMRMWIYQGIAAMTGVPVEYEKKKHVKPKFCPQCGGEKTEMGEPAILISGPKWQCYVCGAKGVWK